MATTATKRIEIDAGHRLLSHKGKCGGVHGHRYAFEFTMARTAEADTDANGMVIDFDEVKAKIGGWLDENWDHALLLEAEDPLVPFITEHDPRTKLKAMTCPPTAENLARLAFYAAKTMLAGSGVTILHVSCYETPTGRAGYAE